MGGTYSGPEYPYSIRAAFGRAPVNAFLVNDEYARPERGHSMTDYAHLVSVWAYPLDYHWRSLFSLLGPFRQLMKFGNYNPRQNQLDEYWALNVCATMGVAIDGAGQWWGWTDESKFFMSC